MTRTAKRRIELELDESLLERANAAGLDLPREVEGALRRRLAAPDPVAAARWKEENREAIEAYNAYIEANGLPLAAYRRYPWPSSTSS